MPANLELITVLGSAIAVRVKQLIKLSHIQLFIYRNPLSEWLAISEASAGKFVCKLSRIHFNNCILYLIHEILFKLGLKVFIMHRSIVISIIA
jgi:hypothetical protein